jgi:hypothetical protein
VKLRPCSLKQRRLYHKVNNKTYWWRINHLYKQIHDGYGGLAFVFSIGICDNLFQTIIPDIKKKLKNIGRGYRI